MIELAIALTIFLTAILFSLSALRQFAAAASRLNEHTEAMAKLENELFRLETEDGGPVPFSQDSIRLDTITESGNYRDLRLSGWMVREKNAVTVDLFLRCVK